MYVLQNCIFVILIFTTTGFPQDDIPGDDVPPDVELPENDLSKNISSSQLNEGENIQTEQTSNDEPEEAEEEEEASEATQLNDEDLYGESDPSVNQEAFKEDEKMSDDGEGENLAEENDSQAEYGEGENFTGENDSQIEYGDDTPQLEHLPGSTEMLDRNKPEPGFDLSVNEMRKMKLWPDGVIPFYIDVHSFSDKVVRDIMRSFLSSVNSLTSLNFVELPSPPTDNSRWVLFINRRGLLGCADHSIKNFTNTGVQHVILGYHCMSSEGEFARAVLAIAGVPPQHNAPDRDYFIKVNNENIMPEKKYLFDKLGDDEWLFHDLDYDFKSAGHFASYTHSKNGRATIEPQGKSKDVTIGESMALTSTDILKIRMLYNYNINKKLLKAPDCHRLFEPGKMFSDYKPEAENILKPRPKPYKYTGGNQNASEIESDEADIISEVTTIADEEMGTPEVFITVKPIDSVPFNDDNYNEIDAPDDAINYDTPKNITDEKDAPDDAINYDTPKDITNDEYQETNLNLPEAEEPYESENLSHDDGTGKKPVIVNIGHGSIQALNKPQFPVLTLKSPMKVQLKDDLLSALSDYRTDDDARMKKKLL